MPDAFLAVMRVDLGEVLRSRWILLCAGVYAVLAALFVLVGFRESSVLGFTGLGRVLFGLCHALVLLLPLLALTGTGAAIARAREDGSLEFWLSQPIGRGAYLAGVTAVRFAAVALPLVVVLLGLAAWGRGVLGQTVPWDLLLRITAVSLALLWAFVALGIATSVLAGSVSRATTWILLFWALGVALLDVALIGLLLQWQLPARTVFALAVFNPVEAARLALLSTAEPELAVLGPVGFYLANRIGRGALFALGTGWPLAFGLGVFGLAWRAFERRDAV